MKSEEEPQGTLGSADVVERETRTQDAAVVERDASSQKTDTVEKDARVQGTAQEYGGIDQFRIVAALLVVAIHTSPLVMFGDVPDFVLTRILARLAVPFFLATTGFFLLAPYAKQRDKSAKPIGRFILKLAGIYGIAMLVYLPLSWYAGYFDGVDSLWQVFKLVCIEGTLYHLWYFPATMLGVALVWLLLRYTGKGVVTLIAMLLYAMGLLGDSYFGITETIPWLSEVYQALFSVSEYMRNGLFYAPVFLMMGVWAAGQASLQKDNQSKLQTNNMRIVFSDGLLFSLLLLLIEGLLLFAFGTQRHDSMYLMLPLCTYFLLVWLSTFKGASSKVLRDLSLLVYIVHPWAIVGLRGLAGALDIIAWLLNNSLIFFVAVCLLSCAISLCVMALGSFVKKGRAFKDEQLSSFASKQQVTPTHTVGKSQRSIGLASKQQQHMCATDSSQKRIGLASKKLVQRAWMTVERAALLHNVEVLKCLVPESCALMPAVKANAYGFGVVEMVQLLKSSGVNDYCVASLSEGIELRKKGVRGEILILGYTHPSDLRLVKRYRLMQTVVDYNHGMQMAETGLKIPVHLKVDTGMHRLGESSEHAQQILRLFSLDSLLIRGIFTQLSCSDSTEDEDVSYTLRQLESFESLIKEIKQRTLELPATHTQCSYGIINYPRTQDSFARPGLALYGIVDRRLCRGAVPDLHPIFEVKCRIALVKLVGAGKRVGYGSGCVVDRKTKVAIITMGYADGLPRSLSGGVGEVLVHEKRVPIIGNICMDQTIIDVSAVEGVAAGDKVTIIGTSGAEEISVIEFSDKAATIPNEIVSRFGERLERIWV